MEAAKSKGENPKRDKAEVLATVSEAVQLAKSQTAAEERAKVDAQGVQQTFATRLSRSNSAERSTTQELVRVVKASEESQKCVLREQRGGERRIEKGEAREMPEAEVKETVKVKLPEQQPEEIEQQEEMKRSARVLEMSDEPKLKAEVSSELEKNNADQTRRHQQLKRKKLSKMNHRFTRLAEVQDRADKMRFLRWYGLQCK